MYYATDITKSNITRLELGTMATLVNRIQHDSLKNTIERLRKVKNIDTKSYAVLKRTLPYCIGATFSDNIRAAKNFEYIKTFIIDIDHIGSHEKVLALKALISEDLRVALAFISPGGDGLKIFFHLEQPITSLKEYSEFYKSFSRSFAVQYKVENSIDFSTSDATRVCFLSHDPTIYYNDKPIPIQADAYVHTQSTIAWSPEEVSHENIQDSKSAKSISDATYKEILSTLNPKTPKKKKNYYVSPQLLRLKEEIPTVLTSYDFHLKKLQGINYGIKLEITHESSVAFITVYHGKKGFTIVKKPHDAALNPFYDALEIILEHCIYTHKDEKFKERHT